LRFFPVWDENDAVRVRRLALVLVPAILAVFLVAGLRSQDRKTRGASTLPAKAPAPDQRVDINHASLEELLRVPGLTPSWARRILRFRPYRTKQDLIDKGIVSSQVYNRIRDYVIAHRDKQ
jgi:competence protein ComEA